MKVVYISTNDVEDLIFTKREIETTLIEDTRNSDNPYQKKTLDEFVKGIDFINNVFVTKGTVIPFDILTTSKEKYLFLVGSSSNDVNKKLLDILSGINYDLSKLPALDMLDIMKDTSLVEKNDFFLINKEYKRLP